MVKLRPLTERDLDVLAELVYMRFSSSMMGLYAQGTAPIDFGGSNGSHHGQTATKLVKHGFVEHRMRGHEWGDVRTTGARGSKVYRATGAGRDAITAWEMLKRGEKIGAGPPVRKWGHTIPSTRYRPLTDAEKAECRRVCHLDMPT